METYRVKHTGAQSIVTTSMNLAGELLRIFTTLEEAQGDFNMLVNFGFCATLSVTMFTQYFWYQKNTELFYERQQQKLNNDDSVDCTVITMNSSSLSDDTDYGCDKLTPDSLTDIQVALEKAVALVERQTTRRRKSAVG